MTRTRWAVNAPNACNQDVAPMHSASKHILLVWCQHGWNTQVICLCYAHPPSGHATKCEMNKVGVVSPSVEAPRKWENNFDSAHFTGRKITGACLQGSAGDGQWCTEYMRIARGLSPRIIIPMPIGPKEFLLMWGHQCWNTQVIWPNKLATEIVMLWNVKYLCGICGAFSSGIQEIIKWIRLGVLHRKNQVKWLLAGGWDGQWMHKTHEND